MLRICECQEGEQTVYLFMLVCSNLFAVIKLSLFLGMGFNTKCGVPSLCVAVIS